MTVRDVAHFVGTKRLSSSKKFWTTTRRGAFAASALSLIIRKRVTSGYCDVHRQAARQNHRRFQTGRTAYNTAAWRRLRAQFLAQHPWCVMKDKDSRCTLVADTVDHVERHLGNVEKMFDWDNLRAMCASCHSRHTARQVGWAGNHA